MTEVRIVSSALTEDTSVKILCNAVVYNTDKNLGATPNATPDTLVEVQTRSYNNPLITIRGVKFTGASDTLTLKGILELMKLNYDGTNAPTISVVFDSYDHSEDTQLISISDTSTTDIPVVLKSFTFNIDVNDSRDAHLPTGTLVFQETA